MKNRILKFLSSENKTSSQFAEEIGVQPSSVSHILSGRNNASLDFVMKMLNRYPYISTQWLLFGSEPMYNQRVSPTLFDNIPPEIPPEGVQGTESEIFGNYGDESTESKKEATEVTEMRSGMKREKEVTRVVIFFNDGTFREYGPSDSD